MERAWAGENTVRVESGLNKRSLSSLGRWTRCGMLVQWGQGSILILVCSASLKTSAHLEFGISHSSSCFPVYILGRWVERHSKLADHCFPLRAEP